MIMIYSVLLVHWVADFICQTDWQAKNKSTNNKALLVHTLNYTAVWAVFLFGLGMFEDKTLLGHYTMTCLQFLGITFVAHTVTDYITSRVNKMLLAKGDTHNFFVCVGFDQILHYAQLFATIQYLVSK